MRDIPDLLDSLKRAPTILSEFVDSIPRQKLDLRRGKGFWTVAEHVSHLAEVQPMLLQRIERFLKEEHPEFIPYLPGKGEEEPDTPARLEMAEALERFRTCRLQQLELLKGLDQETWCRTGTHPEYEAYSLYILVRHILMHDHWHMYRMEELWLARDAYLTRLE
ncbi:DinB family protein [Geomonas sp. Red69]|uniref:DinB family protein n=1 Tax=Geomonas diazotrophica TaxID=2843197 RepID=A0ABX8JQ57_9BACT|nr:MULTISPECIES: DinB family protein [Geomonas]MBU5637254.1 DinB family protein [Geomonas diazotrophica]QWV99547.1 DinB family protein [Geomonas nitrogeniifigens]QXE88722.1 DinB family protein [Geomonas nitrogeniifigens]